MALAALLAGEWEVLLLDEPTNHLDVEAITWLAGHLKRRWPATAGGLLVITHDRWFLDEVCTATWEVHDRLVEPFEGGYAAYILQRVERDRMAATSEAKRQNLARKELAWLRRGAARAYLQAAVPHRRGQRAHRRRARDQGPGVAAVAGRGPARQGRGRPARRVGRLRRHRRAARRRVADRAGRAHRPARRQRGGQVHPARPDHRGQPAVGGHRPARPDRPHLRPQPAAGPLEDHLGEPVRDILARLRTSYTIGTGSKAQDLTPGQLLERLGFSTAQLSTPVKDLSGGQQRRLQLLLILLDQPNVLILDEPTNDMDTDMLAVIEDLLDSWPGTLIVVSHDRYFIERVTDQQYAILSGRLRHLPGGIDEYLRLRLREQSAPAGDPVIAATETAARDAAAGRSRPRPCPGRPCARPQKETAAVERRMARLQTQIEAANNALAEHDPSDYQGLTRRTQEIKQLEAEVTALEERWFELTELTG